MPQPSRSERALLEEQEPRDEQIALNGAYHCVIKDYHIRIPLEGMPSCECREFSIHSGSRGPCWHICKAFKRAQIKWVQERIEPRRLL